MPRVSIIIAAYNPGIHLATTLDAVIAQTFADWEAIVVDDGSTEDLSQFAHVDPRITLVRQPNRGLSAARNAAIMRSSGEFLAFLDQDDIWLPNKLERQLAAMEADPELAFCYTNFHRIDAAGAYIGPGYDGGAETYAGLLLGCCVCVSTAMIRRSYLSAVGTFDPLFVGSQDYDLWLKLARRYKVKYLETASVQYRQHANTISSRYAELYVEICQILKRHAALARVKREWHVVHAARQGLRRARQIYGGQAYDHCRVSIRQRQYGPFALHLSRAIRLAPAFVLRSVVSSIGATLRKRSQSLVGRRQIALNRAP